MKKYLKLILLILTLILISVRLPYRSYSLSQLLIPPIYSKTSNSVFFLSSILQISGIIMIIKEFIRLNFKIDKFIVFLIILFILPPITSSIDSAVYTLNDGVKSIQVTKNYINVSYDEDHIELYTALDLKSHEFSEEAVTLYIEIPDAIKEAYDLNNVFDKELYFNSNTEQGIKYEIELVPKDPNADIDINFIKKSFREYQIVLKQNEVKSRWRLRMH